MDFNEVDAKISFRSFASSKSNEPSRRVMRSTDSLYYASSGDKLRGKCLIFNFEKFNHPNNKNLPERKGSSKDVTRLREVFGGTLKFDVQTWKNLTHSELTNQLKIESGKPREPIDCLVVCFLSHGKANGILCAHDQDFPTEHLFEPFTNKNCPSLVGKPKVFLIQACQGDDFDDGIEVIRHDGPNLSTRSIFPKIPNYTDFMVGYSSYPGFYSWRNSSGSWFMQSLCDTLQEYHQVYDLFTMMTLTLRKVAFHYESRSEDPDYHGKKQIPFITSTLTRLVRFGARKIN